MDWVPIAFGAFKALGLGAGMFFAIKWHYDQGEAAERRAVLRKSGVMAAAFIVAVLVAGLLAFGLGTMLGLDLSYP